MGVILVRLKSSNFMFENIFNNYVSSNNVRVRRCEQTVFIVGLFTSETARKFKIVLAKMKSDC